MENKNPPIDKIIERISADPGAVTERVSGGAREFEFSESSADGGLVFEFSDGSRDAAQPAELSADSTEAVADVAVPELVVPDVFSVDEKYDTPVTADITNHIHPTYVPRFTEVSENYRMKDDPRPRKGTDTAEVTRVERVDPSTEPAASATEAVDPTAELDVESDSAVVVTSRQTAAEEDVSETLNIYKFGEEQEPPAPRERTVEDERAEITRLFSRNEEPAPASEPEAQTVTEEVAAPAVAEPKPRRAEDYRIPDPTDARINVVDFSESAPTRRTSVDPEGVTDVTTEPDKKKSPEFTNKKQRDAFKDRFLDTLMSMRIRIVTAFIFGALLLALECLVAFDVIGPLVPALELIPWSCALFDLILVAGITVLSVPEISKAVKRLLRGRITPELFVPLGFVADAAYTVAVIAVAPMDYPLFGFVYAISVLFTIGAAYAKTLADFASFKMVTKNDEKRILDKKLTRSLPAENMALDGLVDEYKSRTARIFRTSFVSDFFKRTGKAPESPRHTALIFAVSLVAALVVGAVSFFLPSGGAVNVISAFSAFTLVLLLSYPTLSVVAHKLPYMLAQKAAIAEDSTVIGEQAYYDFSDIDVIAFDDTEIFGPDDVNLKRFILYGDQKDVDVTMQDMCSLFSVAGGPLNYIFTGALDARVQHTPAKNPVIEDDGISGDVRGRKICAGTEEYMRRHGIALTDAAGAASGGIDTTKLMYAAKDGEVYAKFYIRYSFSEEFTQLLPTLKEQGIVPLIYTRDPNVSNELLSALTAGSDCMRAVKCHDPGFDDDKLYRSISAGVVTYGDKINAINVILLAKRFKKFSRRISTLEIYAAVVGAALGAVISLLGMWTVPAMVYGLWQIGWCVFLRIYAGGSFPSGKTEL